MLWRELEGVKSRVEDIFRTLHDKVAKQERANELKQNILRSSKLKEYFKENPKEKEVLAASLSRAKVSNVMYRHLNYLPTYCMPKQVLAQEDIDIKMALNGLVQPIDKKSWEKSPFLTLAANLAYADENNKTELVQNMLHYPGWVRELIEQEEADSGGEDPTLVSKEALAPISGRKEWKIRHKKRVKTLFKTDKKGYTTLA